MTLFENMAHSEGSDRFPYDDGEQFLDEGSSRYAEKLIISLQITVAHWTSPRVKLITRKDRCQFAGGQRLCSLGLVGPLHVDLNYDKL